MAERISIAVRRSQLGRARGMGSARAGSHHWYAERVSAIALVPLTLWFIVSVLRLVGAPHEVVVAWASHPVNTVLLLALVVMTFHHMALGLQVVIEDYVPDKMAQTTSILVTKAVCYLLGLLAIVCVVKLTLW